MANLPLLNRDELLVFVALITEQPVKQWVCTGWQLTSAVQFSSYKMIPFMWILRIWVCRCSHL